MKNQIRFTKRKIANKYSSYVFGFFFAIFGIWSLMNTSFNLILIYPGIIFLILGLVILFCKEVTVIQCETNHVEFYFEILFLKLLKKEVTLHEIKYLLIRDFNAKSGSFSRDTFTLSPYYEISFIDVNLKKIVLCVCSNLNSSKEIIKQILSKNNIKFKDNTLEKKFLYLTKSEL